MKSIDRKILILYTSFTKSKKQKHEKKQKEGETNQWKTLKALGPYIYIYIDNFIKNKLYIKYKRLRINLMYKIYMVRQSCPPWVQLG